jgi:glycerol-3-phosphate acyltransferase PlsX
MSSSEASLPIALDAMGGDHAPAEPVAAAVAAARDYGIAVCMVGDESSVRAELAKHGSVPTSITILHAPETIEMHEHPAKALRAKPNASMPVAVGLARDGRAGGAVSAGNSGAIMAAGIFILKRLPGIDRPAFGGIIPTRTGQAFLVDMGANADCKPQWLVQFARMGVVYMRTAQGLANPRVGLVSNGTEEGKGSVLTLAAFDLLRESGLNFVGNIEANGIAKGVADVVVCDGFTGNAILKTMEGTVSVVTGLLRESLQSSLRAKIGGLLVRPALSKMRARVDYAEYGGVPVLGVGGVLINCHGRSKARAIVQGIRLADRMARADLSDAIRRELAAFATAEDPQSTTLLPD